MAENIQLQRPSSGQSSVVPVGPDARLEFAFDQGDANFSKDGQDFVLTFDDGATLRLQGFYDNFGDNAQPPTLVVQGQELPGDQFLAALNNPDLMPAAGPGAGPPMGGGSYEDALLSGVGGVDRLDKLEFDGWGRNTEVTEEYRSLIAEPETPGGTFGLEGGYLDMNGVFVASGIYEDWRPKQHQGLYGAFDKAGALLDDNVLYGKLDFSFTPTGTTVVDGIHLSGFDAGSIIVIGEPLFDADGNLTNGVTVTGPGQVFDFTRANFDSDGVYVLPPPNSDADMNISVTLDLHASSSGRTGVLSGTFTIVVDAVADKPAVDALLTDFVHAETSGAVENITHIKDEGFDGKGYHVVEQETDGTEQVTFTIPFTTTVHFEDYELGHEHHYVLIEVPSEDKDGNALPAGMSWTCADADGNAFGTITGPDGKEYFQIPVDNADIAKGAGDIAVKVNLTVAGKADDVKDAELNLQVGAMAEEQPSDTGEFDFTNNVSFDWKDGGADVKLDVIDGGLTIKAGWASEGNNDAKHLGQGSEGYDLSKSPENVLTGHDPGLDHKSTGETAAHANTGAPISIAVDSGAGEVITSVTLTYDAGEGHIWQLVGGVWTDMDPTGTGVVTIGGLSSPALDTLAYRPNAGSYSDQDVDIHYTVNVTNAAHITGSYSGDFTVVVDAVADRPDVAAGTPDYGDTFENPWGQLVEKKAAEPGEPVTLKTTVAFHDLDGSEKHYVLVECKAGMIDGTNGSYTLTVGGVEIRSGDFSDGDLSIVTVGGKTYYQIEVPDPAGGDQYANVDVALTVNGPAGAGNTDVVYSVSVGGRAEEQAGLDHTANLDETREYDLANNVANEVTTISFTVSPIKDSEGKTTNTSEDQNPYQHLEGGVQGADAGTVTIAMDGATFSYKPSDNLGAPGPGLATFTGALHTVAGLAQDQITEVRLYFAVDYTTLSDDTGLLKYNAGTNAAPDWQEIPWVVDDAAGAGMAAYCYNDSVTGNVVFVINTLTGATPPVSLVVQFHPAADSDNDFTFSYAMDTFNPNTGEAHTWAAGAPAPALVVVDAVADRPDMVALTQEQLVDYGANSAIAPDGEATLTVGATFKDYLDGSEQHYILIQKETTTTLVLNPDYDPDDPSSEKFLSVPGEKAQFDLIDGSPFTLWNEDHSSQVGSGTVDASSTVTINGIVYYKIEVDNDVLKDITPNGSGAAVLMDFVVKLDADAPPHADGTYTLNYGSLAVETTLSGAESTSSNNAAFDLGTLEINVGVVESVPKIAIGNYKIYENLTKDAHLGDENGAVKVVVPGENGDPDTYYYERAGSVQDGAEIKLSGLHEGETTTIAFTFDFKSGTAGPDAFTAADGHEDDFMRIALVDGNGDPILDSGGNPVEYPVLWDASANGGAGAWTCAVTVDSDLAYAVESVINGETVVSNGMSFVLMPGYNYNSTDLTISYDIKVVDDASGHTLNWTNGDSKDPSLPELTVIVDAVAQQPDIESALGYYDNRPVTAENPEPGQYTHFKAGGLMTIEAKVEYRDYRTYDDSEKHYLLVQKQLGWEPPKNYLEIKYTDSDGHDQSYTLTGVTWTVQCYVQDGQTFYYWVAEVPNSAIETYGAAGTVDMLITMQSPSDVGASASFKVGAGSHETVAAGDQEISWDNNNAFVFTDPVEILFNGMGSFKLTPTKAYLYENDTPNANMEVGYSEQYGFSPTVAPGTLDADGKAGGMPFTLDVSAHHEVDDFKFTNYDTDKGTLYYHDPDSGALVKINDDGSIPGNPTLTDGAQFTFIPAYNYSEADFDLTYTGTITNDWTGQSLHPNQQCLVSVDAVAQMPGEMDVPYSDHLVTAADLAAAQPGDYPEGTLPSPQVDWSGTGGTFDMQVTVLFEDYATDGTEQHFVLVECVQNMHIVGATETFSVRNPDGTITNYWKVPVDNNPDTFKAVLDAEGNPTHFGQATVTVTAYMAGGSDDLHLRDSYPGSIKVGALAEEIPSDGELTYDNNFAFRFGGDVGMDWNWGTGEGGGEGCGIWVPKPAYENDEPNAHIGDFNKDGGTQVQFVGPTTWADVQWNPGQGYFIDSNGNKYDSGTATLDSQNHTVDFYFIPTGHSDEDVTLSYQCPVCDGGDGMLNAIASIIIDAVGTKPSWGTDSYGHIYDVLYDHGVKIPQDPSRVPAMDVKYHEYDTHGDIIAEHKAMGAKDGSGNDGECTLHIAGIFLDTDGSETHYALVEARPGWEVRDGDGNLGEMVFLDGKTYFRVEMAKDGGNYKLDADGKEYADVTIRITDPDIIDPGQGATSGSYKLAVGLMVEEHPSDLELTMNNNVSWTLGAEAVIETSFVNSSVSVSNPSGNQDEAAAGADTFTVNINFSIDEHDLLAGDKITVTISGGGTFDDAGLPSGVTVSADGKALYLSKDYVDSLGEGGSSLPVQIIPEPYSDADITFSVSGAAFYDELSGDARTLPSPTPHIIVDADANAPTFTASDVFVTNADGSAAAAVAGGVTVIKVTMNFADYDGSELHYAVLEQGNTADYKNWIENELLPPYVPKPGEPDSHAGDRGEWDMGNAWRCEGASYYDASTDTWHAADVVTLYDMAGNPYSAIVIPDDVLQANNGDVTVKWDVRTPNSTEGDIDTTLTVGGISVETATGAGADKELTLDNNWKENLQEVDVKAGTFDTWAVNARMDGELFEDGGAPVSIVLGAPWHITHGNAGLQEDRHEFIEKTALTFNQEGAAPGELIGVLTLNGTEYPVYAGVPVDLVFTNPEQYGTVTLAGVPNIGYNPALDTITFQLAESNHNSNPLSVEAKSTVTDAQTGVTRTNITESDDQPQFSVTGVADRPDINPADTFPDKDIVASGETVTVETTATFVDLDGSENHYVLVQALPGWTCDDPKLVADGDGKPILYSPDGGVTQYFMIDVTDEVPAGGTLTRPVELIADRYEVGSHYNKILVGGLALETETRIDGEGNEYTVPVVNDPGVAFTPGGYVEVTIEDNATLSLVNNAITVNEGGELSFTLALADDGHAYTAADPMTVTLTLSLGAHVTADDIDLAGIDGATCVANGDGTYLITFILPAGESGATFTIPVLNDKVLESLESLTFEVGSIDAGSLVGFVAPDFAVGDGYQVDIVDMSSATLSLVNLGGTSVDEGDSMFFDLQLSGGAVSDEPLTVTLKITGTVDAATDAALTGDGWTLAGGAYTKDYTLPAGANSLSGIEIPTGSDNVLNAGQSVTIAIADISTSDALHTLPAAGAPVSVVINDADEGKLALVADNSSLDANGAGTLSFELQLRNTDGGGMMTAAAAITATFVVDNSDHSFLPPADIPGVTSWESNGAGGYLLHVTLPADESTVSFTLDVAHTYSGDHVIDAAQTLSVTLDEVASSGGMLAGLDATGVDFVDQHGIATSDHQFPLVDSEYAAASHLAGVDADALAAAGDSGFFEGGDGDDILVGGTGADIFTWSNLHDGDSDVITNFTPGDDIIHFQDIFGAVHGTLDAMLSSATFDTDTNTLSASNTNGTFEAQLGVDKIVLTLTDNGGATQTIEVNAAAATQFWDNSGGEQLTVATATEVLLNMIKDGVA